MLHIGVRQPDDRVAGCRTTVSSGNVWTQGMYKPVRKSDIPEPTTCRPHIEKNSPWCRWDDDFPRGTCCSTITCGQRQVSQILKFFFNFFFFCIKRNLLFLMNNFNFRPVSSFLGGERGGGVFFSSCILLYSIAERKQKFFV